MTYKQIETAHEVRMWIGQVIVPTVAAVVIIAANPNIRAYVKQKVEDIKWKIKSKKNKSGN